MDCISLGKALVPHKFGTKVSIAMTIDEGFVVGMRAVLGNRYVGQTPAGALEQVDPSAEASPDCRGSWLPRAQCGDDKSTDQRQP